MTSAGAALRLVTVLGALAASASIQIGSIFLDACNLQLFVEPARPSSLNSMQVDDLSRRLLLLSRYVAYLDPYTVDVPDGEPPATVCAVFDGAAFHGEHAGCQWQQCDEPEGVPAGGCSPGLRVVFTEKRASADDVLLQMVQEEGAKVGCAVPEQISAKQAGALLSQEPLPRPVVAAVRQRSLAGRSKREQREAFLRTCGLPRVGDIAHLPAFTEAQRERSIALLRGLDKLENAVTYSRLDKPVAMVVSDDRGLRRRCFELPCPPVVLGRNQLLNWLSWLPAELEEQDGEGAGGGS